MSGAALVLGAGGFLGSHLARGLARRGWQVTGLVRDPDTAAVRARFADAGNRPVLVRGDAREPAVLGRLLDRADIVYCLTGPRHGAADPPPRDRGGAPVTALLRALDDGNRHVRAVFAGSRLQYGSTPDPPVAEGHPRVPRDWYGAEKNRQEADVASHAAAHGLDTCWLRISVAYGPGQALTGRPFGVVGRFLATAGAGGRIPLYDGGWQRRDFVHVDDLIDVFELAGTHARAGGEVFNVGGPEPVSLATLAGVVADVAGAPPPVSVASPPNWSSVETGDYWADLTKIRRLLDWTPSIKVHEGVAATWSGS